MYEIRTPISNNTSNEKKNYFEKKFLLIWCQDWGKGDNYKGNVHKIIIKKNTWSVTLGEIVAQGLVL